jgi:hypothetical protein
MNKIIVCVIVLMLWVWNMCLNHPSYTQFEYSEVEHKFKTGDIILFHGLDNCVSIVIGCYYTHIGIIYVDADGQPYVLEAFNPQKMPYYPEANSSGIIMTPAARRLQTYRGYVFYKELEHPITDAGALATFARFIEFAHKNMFYECDVVSNGVAKLLFNDSLRLGTNCGELVYLSLIALGVLPSEEFDRNNKHHLLYLSNLRNVASNAYREPVYIMSNYFEVKK